jgi:hypothetical protein
MGKRMGGLEVVVGGFDSVLEGSLGVGSLCALCTRCTLSEQVREVG